MCKKREDELTPIPYFWQKNEPHWWFFWGSSRTGLVPYFLALEGHWVCFVDILQLPRYRIAYISNSTVHHRGCTTHRVAVVCHFTSVVASHPSRLLVFDGLIASYAMGVRHSHRQTNVMSVIFTATRCRSVINCFQSQHGVSSATSNITTSSIDVPQTFVSIMSAALWHPLCSTGTHVCQLPSRCREPSRFVAPLVVL